MKNTVSTVLLAIAFVVAQAAFAQSAFETFSPKNKAFTVSIPGEVHFKEVKKKDLSMEIYSSGDADGAFVVESGIDVDSASDFDALSRGILKGIEESSEENGNKFEIENTKECSGPGWSGKRYDCKLDGTKPMSVLVALSDNKDSVVSLLTTATDKDRANKFLDSLSVNADAATQSKPLEESKAYKEGKQAGYVLGFLLVVSFFVGMVVLIFKLIFRKPKEQPTNTTFPEDRHYEQK